MAFKIKIYGEIVPFQDKWITDQGGYINLSFIQEQLNLANGEDIVVHIKSYGGDVEEGFSIYSELRRYAQLNNAKITTLADGQCASIATVFFLAGDERIVTAYTQPFVHNAWCYAMGDSKTLQRISADLESCNDMIAKHYEEHTDLTYEEARELMNNETYITPEECVRLRFATSIEQVQRPAAMKNIINKSNTNVKMAKNSKKVQTKNQTEKSFINKLREIFNKDVFTADNQIVDFYELEDNETVAVGAKANIDGKPAEGEVIIASGETYVFEKGELIEIKEVEGDEPKNAEEEEKGEEGPADETQALKDRITELEAEVEEKESKIEELEDLLEKASNKVNQQEQSIKNFKETVSKFAGDQRKDNKGNGGEENETLSESIKQFKQNKFNKTK